MLSCKRNTEAWDRRSWIQDNLVAMYTGTRRRLKTGGGGIIRMRHLLTGWKNPADEWCDSRESTGKFQITSGRAT